MDITSERQIIITLGDQEAKLLGALIGSISPKDADDLIRRSFYFSTWLGDNMILAEVSTFVQNLFEGLYEQIEGKDEDRI